jgi:[NiFe] hydrogenase diaphorase moiety large subunit
MPTSDTMKTASATSQPSSSAATPQVAAVVDAAVKEFAADRTRLMDIVQAIQHRLGYISDQAVHAVAAGLGIHAVEVEDMVSFYGFLNRKPKGRFDIRLSKTPVSLIKGAAEVALAFAAASGAGGP